MKHFAVFVGLAVAAVGVGAQQSMERDTGDTQNGAKTFTEMDHNRDGVLTQGEVEQASFAGNFDELDKDGDAQVNRNEYYQYYRDRITQGRD